MTETIVATVVQYGLPVAILIAIFWKRLTKFGRLQSMVAIFIIAFISSFIVTDPRSANIFILSAEAWFGLHPDASPLVKRSSAAMYVSPIIVFICLLLNKIKLHSILSKNR